VGEVRGLSACRGPKNGGSEASQDAKVRPLRGSPPCEKLAGMGWQAIAEVWTELIAAVVGAVLGWFTKHYRDNRRNKR